jgi:phage terminase large subunit-like protein
MGLEEYKKQYIDNSGGNNRRQTMMKHTKLNPPVVDEQYKASLVALEKELLLVEKRKTEQKILFYKPYAKQQKFHEAGLTHRQRLLMAANRVGKTYCGAAEVAIHLTGMYPIDWKGRVWKRPTRWWVSGITALNTRDIVQKMLMGTVATGWGTGMIPKDHLNRDDMSLARGVSDLYDTVLVKNNYGGKSELMFKSYEQGREKWQGDTLDGIWYDEEPPEDIYAEGYTRIVLNQGMSLMTFTPLLGRSKVVNRFLESPSSDMHVTTMTIEDAGHIPKEEIESIIAGYPEHEREARARGIPLLGSGAIFNIPESQIIAEPFDIPAHWALIWGVDFGTEHPFAAVLAAWDRDTDTIYVIHTVKMKDATPLQHVEAMKHVLKGFGIKVPVAWPHDGAQRKDFEGALVPLRNIYKKHGLNMHGSHATFEDGSNATEIGVLMMYERMKSNRFKVFKQCSDWFAEYRMYHRKDGMIVKQNDDLLSATRMAVMMRRIAKPVLFYGDPRSQARSTPMAKGLDMDPWSL